MRPDTSRHSKAIATQGVIFRGTGATTVVCRSTCTGKTSVPPLEKRCCCTGVTTQEYSVHHPPLLCILPESLQCKFRVPSVCQSLCHGRFILIVVGNCRTARASSRHESFYSGQRGLHTCDLSPFTYPYNRCRSPRSLIKRTSIMSVHHGNGHKASFTRTVSATKNSVDCRHVRTWGVATDAKRQSDPVQCARSRRCHSYPLPTCHRRRGILHTPGRSRTRHLALCWRNAWMALTIKLLSPKSRGFG